MGKLNYTLEEEIIHSKCGGKITILFYPEEGEMNIECDKCGEWY